MKKITVNLPVVFISMIVVGLVIAGACHAEIDLEACMGAWLFDEGSGDEAADWTGKENNGEIDGAEWVDGKFGKALDFDGEKSQVIIEDNEVFNDIDEINWYGNEDYITDTILTFIEKLE